MSAPLPASSVEMLSVRGAAVLEGVGTAEARALLADLARGPVDDRLTREARAAHARAAGR
jgi:hypothetical protein